MIPHSWHTLAGTLPEQLAHLKMDLAGERCPIPDLPKTGIRRHVYERETAEPHEPVRRFAPSKDPRGEKPEGVSDRDWAAAHSAMAKRVREVLKKAKRPVQTPELLIQVSISRSYMLRVLNALQVAGHVRMTGKRGAGNLMMWEAV